MTFKDQQFTRYQRTLQNRKWKKTRQSCYKP